MRSAEILDDKQARKRILDALDIEARLTATMPEALRARILANLPSAEEIKAVHWSDSTLTRLSTRRRS